MAAKGRELRRIRRDAAVSRMILVTSPHRPEITRVEDLKGRIAGVHDGGLLVSWRVDFVLLAATAVAGCNRVMLTDQPATACRVEHRGRRS